jgi:cyanophycin synthetase
VRLDDARRLTGPNLYGAQPLVLLELFLDEGESAASVRDVIQKRLKPLRAQLGLGEVELRIVRAQPGWVALAHDAPLDEMLLSAELLERTLTGAPLDGLALQLEPQLDVLAREARRRDVPFLWDDERISLGHGKRSRQYTHGELPEIDDVPWSELGAIPVAMVTGTNGKTTSTRLLTRMVRESGRAVGMTSSDAVTIAGRTLHEGDWTGPAAAREVLRSHEVEVAVLETARGGILRRGLACDSIDVALLTNISDDHLGGYGVNTLEDMAQVKAVVANAARHVVLNARDERLRALSLKPGVEVTWFADVDGGAPRSANAVLALNGQLVVTRGGVETALLPINSIPITFQGAARYNVENALGATAAALALGVPTGAIITALQHFTAADNPGRGETWTHDGVTLFIDYAHNPDGVASALQVANSLRAPSGRLTVITGSAGDRPDEELNAVCERISAHQPAAVYVRELSHYLRGRRAGEVSAFFIRQLGARLATSEVEALTSAAATSQRGDVIALLVHVDRDEVRAHLEQHGWQRSDGS